MKVYYSTDFTGHWPVGTAAVVRAESITEAQEMLDTELKKQGLVFDGSLTEFKGKGVIVLDNGDY